MYRRVLQYVPDKLRRRWWAPVAITLVIAMIHFIYIATSAWSTKEIDSHLVHTYEEPLSFNFPEDIRRVDVVIPAHSKDTLTLEPCIRAVRKFVNNLGRVIVVSKQKMTNSAEFYPESKFPFSYADIENYLRANRIFKLWPMDLYHYYKSPSRAGWYFAQIIKLYVVLTIPKVSNDVVVLDSDVILTRPINFTTGEDKGYYGATDIENWPAYMQHMQCLVPHLRKVHSNLSGVVHHQLMMRDVVQDLMDRVEKYHKKPFWHAFMSCIDLGRGSVSEASEYEIMFNFALRFHKDRSIMRMMRWFNDARRIPDELLQNPLPDHFKDAELYGDMVSVHHYNRAVL
jgi:hypothetical protein